MPDNCSSHHYSSTRLCFGTVQLGMPYGAANHLGMPNDDEAQLLIREALSAGVTLFDTAQVYGESETRLGQMHKVMRAHGAEIITKIAPLTLAEGEALAQLAMRVEAHIHQSLSRLQLTTLPYVLLHRPEHLQLYDGCIWVMLKKLQAQGLIGRLGVSVSTPDEVKLALATPEVSCVQVPFNIVDARLIREHITPIFAQRRDVLVCVRSVFLQGVLTQDGGLWPVLPYAEAAQLTGLLDGFVTQFRRDSRADLCLAYVRAQPWVDVVVLGMESLQQLRHNVALFETVPLRASECAEIEARLPALPEVFLNPALWPKKGT